MRIIESSEKTLRTYNNTQNVVSIAFKSIGDIFTLNFGDALKRWLVDKKLNTLTVEKKNFLLTQEVRKIIILQKYQGKNINDDDLERFSNHLDEFLEKKLKEKLGEDIAKLFIDAITKLELKEETKFNEFIGTAAGLLEGNKERNKEIREGAKTLEGISYPLTKKYFLCRYLAKAVIYKLKEENTRRENGPLLEQSEIYKNEKNLCLSFSKEKEIDDLKKFREESNKIIQKAEEQFSSKHKYINSLLRVSNAVNSHSGKIAATYVAYVIVMTGIRYGLEDEKDNWWYEYIAAPSTALAMLQIFSSFPQILFSNTKARKIDNDMLVNFQGDKFDAIKFIDKNIPSFLHDMLSKVAIGSRWLSNMMLQPIDLIQDDTKDLVLGLTSLRLLTPAGVIEEQSKVAHFAKCELRNFFYKNVISRGSGREENSQYINRFFYLLYTQIGEKEQLKRVYEELTGKQNVDLCKIVSTEERKQILSYKWWLKTTYIAATIAFIFEYTCFATRKYVTQDYVDWYEDPIFYAHAAVKFMRFGSLVASKHWANKVIKYITGNELNDNLSFQDFFCNDIARMVLAVAPLIVYESTSDVKILSIATAVDVLTTVRSDMKCGNAIAIANDFSTRKSINKRLKLRDLQSSKLKNVVVENQNRNQTSL